VTIEQYNEKPLLNDVISKSKQCHHCRLQKSIILSRRKKPKHTQSAPKARAESPGRAACFGALSRIREAEEVFDVMSQTTPAYGTIRLFYYSFNRRLYADYVRFSFK